MPHNNTLPEWKFSSTLIPYEEAIEIMESRVADIHSGIEKELIWFLEHPPLYTAGTSANKNDLLSPNRFPVYQTGRGGQYTYHGPGQRVVYVMLDLTKRGKDVRKYVCNLEQWVINSLGKVGVAGERRSGRVGVWVVQDDSGSKEDKVAAIGVRVRKWVSFHGICINIKPNLSHYTGIVPCGINQHGVTSLYGLGLDVTMAQMDKILKEEWIKIFNS